MGTLFQFPQFAFLVYQSSVEEVAPFHALVTLNLEVPYLKTLVSLGGKENFVTRCL